MHPFDLLTSAATARPSSPFGCSRPRSEALCWGQLSEHDPTGHNDNSGEDAGDLRLVNSRATGRNNVLPKWKPSFLGNSNGVKVALGVATVAASIVLLAAPTAVQAIDLALLSGGAATAVSNAATATNSWLASVYETGFYQAFTLVFLSEIGDKTFFIAGLLAIKTSRFVSFLGSIGALAVMTVISVVIGQVFHSVPTGLGEGVPLDDLAAVVAFAYFGIKIIKESLEMGDGDGESGLSGMEEELEEAKETVDSSTGIVANRAPWGQVASIFALVFAAEFGDRSFISTIALSAAQNPVSVAGGAIAAHAVATGVAVGTGSVVAKYISEKVIGLIGGTLFLVFAVTTAMGIF